MKLLNVFKEQLTSLGELRYVWMTSFNISIEFIETYLLPAVLDMEQPKNRLDYEHFQIALTEKKIDFRIFCDKRFMGADKNKRTAIPVHGVSPSYWDEWFSKESLFHPKVIYLEDIQGKKILGCGSANLTISGWGRNQEVFTFAEIDTKAQYHAVKQFFDQIAENVAIDERLPERKGLPAGEGKWTFVHSFQDDTFLEQLFANTHAKELMVWSPYLPKDLAGFVQRLKNSVGHDELEVHLVPDRINGQYIRTAWSDELQAMVESGRLTLYDNPSEGHDNVELCHAKVWKIGAKLALGSWNFTGPGSNLLNKDGEWDTRANIEAGVVVSDSNAWRNAVGEMVLMNSANFASDELLKEEGLYVPDQLPFDLRVNFDWRTQRYDFSGCWHEGNPSQDYAVTVPDEPRPIPLVWRPQKPELNVESIVISNPLALLSERRFEVLHAGKVVLRALITETGLTFRRVQAFDSLSDLLDAFVFGGEPGPGDAIPFRLPASQNSESLDIDLIDEVQENVPSIPAEISYFRLFQATHQYAQKLEATKTLAELNSWVFTRPGCLLELVEKAKAKITEDGVFNWFLAQEVITLCTLARKKAKSFGRTEESMPTARWDELSVQLPQLPKDIQREYLEMIRKGCGYEQI